MEEYMQVALMPTTQSFLDFLSQHAGKDALLGQWGYCPEGRGEQLSEEQARQHPECQKWLGQSVFDAPGLTECFIGQKLEGDLAQRLKTLYVLWCEGHLGDKIHELVQLPGAAVFRTDEKGEFTEVAYLWKKNGPGNLDWDIFVCSDPEEGLCVKQLDGSWTHWGLINMVLRYNVHGEMTSAPVQLQPGEPYACVLSSVLNCRDGRDHHLITCVPHGTILRLTGNLRENWTECILPDGTVGWLFTKFLVKHNV